MQGSKSCEPILTELPLDALAPERGAGHERNATLEFMGSRGGAESGGGGSGGEGDDVGLGGIHAQSEGNVRHGGQLTRQRDSLARKGKRRILNLRSDTGQGPADLSSPFPSSGLTLCAI